MNERTSRPAGILALALALLAGSGSGATAQSNFPDVPVWSYPGAFQAGSDSIREQARTATLRFLRDPVTEARPDFGGYRIYRVTNTPDTSRMVLIRRYSKQAGDSLVMWHFPNISAATPIEQRVASFVDPDSSGTFFKRCRRLDDLGRCISPGDSIIVLMAPPGPHDGFRTWYAVTLEQKNASGGSANEYADLHVPDTVNCPTPQDPPTCPNLNHKAANMTMPEVEPTSGPSANLERVSVVPNPFRSSEAWDSPSGHEVHFINLPPQSRISIYTLAGDLVAELVHNDNVRDFERWDLKNGKGNEVGSGIYIYRVVSDVFEYQNRFVVIR